MIDYLITIPTLYELFYGDKPIMTKKDVNTVTVKLVECISNKQKSTKNATLNDVIQRAMNDAAYKGDKDARDWLTKYVFKDINPDIKGVEQKINTDKTVIATAVDALCALGYRKRDAKDRVNSCVTAKDYEKWEELFTGATRK